MIWVILYILFTWAGGMYYWVGKDVKAKRDTWPLFMLAGALLFLCVVVFFFQVPFPALLLVLVLVGVVTAHNIVAVRFCSRCARLVNRGVLFSRTAFCPRCGAALEG